VNATRFIARRWRFVGQRVLSGQALDWPRWGAYDSNQFLWEDVVPPIVAQATAEYALLAISGALLFPTPDPSNQGAITSRSETIGPHSESFSFASPVHLDLPRFPEQDRLLQWSGLVRGKRRNTIRG